MSAIAFSIGPLTVRWYGVLIVSGIILAVFISNRLAARHNIPFDSLLDLALVCVPLGPVSFKPLRAHGTGRKLFCLFLC